MLKNGDFVKVTNIDLAYCLNGIVLSVDKEEKKAYILCPELDTTFPVDVEEEGPFGLYVGGEETNHFLIKKVDC